MSETGPLVLILVMLVVFYVFLLRPQRAQQRQMRDLQQSLAVGQEVVLSAGIFGTVRGLDEARAQVEVAPGTVLTVARQVVVRRVEPTEAPAADHASDHAADQAGLVDRAPENDERA